MKMRGAWLLAFSPLAFDGCLFSGSGGEPPLARADWDMRLILNTGSQPSAVGDTVYLYLNGKGRISDECREWKGSTCWWGTHYNFDSAASWVYTQGIENGDTVGYESPLVYEYGADGKILFSREFMQGKKQPYYISEFRYDSGGNLTDINRYYDFVGGSSSAVWSFTYDSAGRMDSLYYDHLFDRISNRYTYDAAGRLTRITGQFGGYLQYDRDLLGRISVLKRHDSAGNEWLYPVQYRNTVIRYEPDPFWGFFMPAWFF
ncbi:MAG: RHS repeat domain-containing protein [Fibrobacteria bacterium]